MLLAAHALLHSVLSVGGVLMIDDYGWLLGAQIATDQYIAENRLPLFLSRINLSVRLVIKPPQSFSNWS